LVEVRKADVKYQLQGLDFLFMKQLGRAQRDKYKYFTQQKSPRLRAFSQIDKSE